jgi:hypothetical protein
MPLSEFTLCFNRSHFHESVCLVFNFNESGCSLMTTLIWIEPVKRPDGMNRYTDRGLLLCTRLGGPYGEIICDVCGYTAPNERSAARRATA